MELSLINMYSDFQFPKRHLKTIGIECASDSTTAVSFFSNVLNAVLHLDWLCPGEAQLLLVPQQWKGPLHVREILQREDPSSKF